LHYIQIEVNAILDKKTTNTIYNIYKKQWTVVLFN
jgi:hypothetical protein